MIAYRDGRPQTSWPELMCVQLSQASADGEGKEQNASR